MILEMTAAIDKDVFAYKNVLATLRIKREVYVIADLVIIEAVFKYNTLMPILDRLVLAMLKTIDGHPIKITRYLGVT